MATATENELDIQSSQLPQTSFIFFQDMKKSGVYSDVVLRAAELAIPAHSIVIAAAIPYLRNALRNKGPENIVDIPGVDDLKSSAIESMIEYAYHGRIRGSVENVIDVLPVACRFEMEEMRDICCRFLADNFHPENVMKVQDLARQLGCQDLIQNAEKYSAKNFDELSQAEEFLNCSFSDLKELIKRDDLMVDSEEKVYESVMRWVSHDPERKDHLPELICYVRLPLLEPSFLRLRVAKNKLIRDSVCRDWVDDVTNYLMFPKEVDLSSDFNNQPRCYVSANDAKTKEDKQTEILASEQPSCDETIENIGERSVPEGIQQEQPHALEFCGVTKKQEDGAVGPRNLQSRRDEHGESYRMDGVFELQRSSASTSGVDKSQKGAVEKHNLKLRRGEQNEPNRLDDVLELQHSAPSTDTTDAEDEDNGGMYAFHAKLVFSIQHFNDRTRRWLVKKRDFVTINTASVTGLNNRICFLDCENMCYYNPRCKQISFTERYVQGRASTAVGDQLYVFGGSDGNEVFDTAECFDLENEEWVYLESMQLCREYAGCVVLGEYIYVIGGNDVKGVHRTVERYDIQGNQWIFVEPTLTERSKLGAASLNGKIYICGGIISLEEQECATTAEVYDPNTDTWTPISPLNIARAHFTLLPYAGKLYAVGGCDENDVYVNAVDVYSPRKKKWKLGQPMAADLQITGAAVI